MKLSIVNGYVVTMNEAREIFDGGFVSIGEDGRIEAVGPASAAPTDSAVTVIDAKGMIVLPGLVDACHSHWHNLMMGLDLAGQAPEPKQLREFSARFVDDDTLAASATVAAQTLLRGGTTCVMNAVPDCRNEAGLLATIDAMSRVGLRQVQALHFPASKNPVEVRERLTALIKKLHLSDEGRVRIAIEVSTSAHATFHGFAKESATTEANRLAVAYDLRVFTRSSAADGARLGSLERATQHLGRSDVLHLMELGVLDSRWTIVGAEFFCAADVSLAIESGCSAVCTPMASSWRGLPLGPWPELLRGGVPCALGSDLSTQISSLDTIEQMKSCLLLNNAMRLDPTAMSAERVIEMATIYGAQALGLAQEIGSLEVGKRADISVFDLRGVHAAAFHKPISVFVACASATDAALVVVDGRVCVKTGFPFLTEDSEPSALPPVAEARQLRHLWNASSTIGA